MSIEILAPDLGSDDSFPVVEILVQVGDKVEKDEAILLLESDKATMEIPASEAGVISEIKVAMGDKVKTNDLVAMIETNGKQQSPAPSTETKSNANSTSSNNSTIDILAPDLGSDDSFPVVEILVSIGDKVEKDEAILLLESDKATMEIPASEAGVISEIKVAMGDKVKTNDLVATITGSSSATSTTKPAQTQEATSKKSSTKQSQPTTTVSKAINESSFKDAHASPSIRKFARELGANLGAVVGTGRKGRITKDDVQSFVKGILTGATTSGVSGGTGIPKIASVDFSKFGSVEEQKLSRINVLTGEHMTKCWLNIPHVTQNDEADITDLEIFRKSLRAETEKIGVRLSMLSFLMKAVAAAMKEFPKFNSSLSSDGKSLVMKQYFNIGIAVDTPTGLVVPVIKDVDKKSIYELSRDLMNISKKARDGKLTPSDLSGGCMTISSLGGIGGTTFTPIVNAPEVAILGVSRSKMQPVWNGSEFIPRNILPMSLSYDHRVIDGADGARFTQYLSKLLEDARRLLL